jgi:Leucine-rich repeat (LRR) protein
VVKRKHHYLWKTAMTIMIGSGLVGCAQSPQLNALTFMDPNFQRCVATQGKQDLQQITTLECSHFKIRDAREVRYLTHLKTLDLSSNQLTNLDVSHNRQLQVLSVEHNKLSHLKLNHNLQLQIVNVNFNHLTALDVSHNPLLTYLNYDDTLINHLDISRNPHLLAPFYTLDEPNGPTIMAE